MAIPGNFLSAVAEMVDPDTSGWTTTLNCTKSLGSGGRNGDGVLTITSVASGDMQAATSAAYRVTAGTVYQAFADAASSTQPERIGIQWLNASYAAVGTATWSLTTDAASASWHRISVAAPAPVGAIYARVALSATTTAAARTHFFENVYLGPPQRTSGNLLSFNAESGGDIDGTAWAVDANCTIARDVPVVTWPVSWYLSGGEVVKATTTANGNMSVKCSETPSVQPGVDYRGYLYINAPTSSAACWVELRWMDGNGTLISTKRAALAPPAAVGWYRQIVSGVAPAGAAHVVLAAGVTSATAAQVLRVEGATIQQASAAPVAIGTVMPYEDASFEQGVGQWTVASGVATIARSTPWGAAGYDGVYAMVVTSSTATTSVLASGKYPVVAGLNWRAQIQFSAASGTWGVAPQIHWYDASGVSLGASSLPADSLAPAGGWWRDWNDIIAPASAASARVEVDITAPSAGAVCQLDAVSLTQTAPAFSATADSSRAVVTLVMRELTVGATLTVYRVVGSTQAVVRGSSGALQGVVATSAQMVVEDYEAPLGVDVWYRIEQYDATTGDFGGSEASATVRLALADVSDCWIKDPLQPQRNVLVRASAAPDWARPIEQTEYRVRGRRNSVILSDVRGGLTGTLAVWTDDDPGRGALHFALDSGNPLLIQFSPGLGLDDSYYAVGDITEARPVAYGGEPRRLWSLALTQQDAPIGGVGGTAGWTVQDVLTTWPTALDVATAYATVLDLVLDNREA
ncbi:hypothetical protein RVR_8329 [Actinacidiphila reveromycinica]|uniref:Uncharacterized protein n=1 Tax=Actinacidiphila reveromycinica TaxID=659352 RepID=A0A7U3VRR6_9ACTN|nr:hypothetical protein RVR_8329 [Streptomyces sp. SN-593]